MLEKAGAAGKIFFRKRAGIQSCGGSGIELNTILMGIKKLLCLCAVMFLAAGCPREKEAPAAPSPEPEPAPPPEASLPPLPGKYTGAGHYETVTYEHTFEFKENGTALYTAAAVEKDPLMHIFDLSAETPGSYTVKGRKVFVSLDPRKTPWFFKRPMAELTRREDGDLDWHSIRLKKKPAQ